MPSRTRSTWVALANPKDQWHKRAVAANRSLRGARLITTEEVLGEFLAHFSPLGRSARDAAVLFVEATLRNPSVVVHAQSHRSFLDGLALYKARPDKGYSLTDCISMSIMHRDRVLEVLTYDHHFAQEGFSLLL
jgi:uncharacterized protein